MVIRTVIFGLVGSTRKEISQERLELERDLNDMHELKTQACRISGINVMNDATKAWNMVPSSIKTEETQLKAKRLIKEFVKTLPI